MLYWRRRQVVKVYDIKGALAGTNEHLGQCRHTVECNGSIKGIAAADDNDKVVVASQNRASEVGTAFTGDRLNVLVGHTAKANCACITGDGNTIISCSDDRSVCL